MNAPQIELVAAVAANGVIGRNGTLPWHLPDDLGHFKNLTMGHPVIMGRGTLESIDGPLPGRRCIVVSTRLDQPPAGFELAHSLHEAVDLVKSMPGPIFVVGGSVLFAAAMPHAQVMHLTELDEPVEGDVFFPSFDPAQWRLAQATRHEKDARHAIAFRICRYERMLPV